MKEIQEFLKKIKEGSDNYSLGEPWKFSKDNVGVVVPILRKNAEKRDYTTYPEVDKKVDFEDKGAISPITAIPNVKDLPVFIRAGTLLEGISGQDRAVIHSMIFDSVKDIEVRCVHASRPTRKGGKFKYQGYTPRKVQQNLHKGQNKTWGGVRAFYSASLRQPYGSSRSRSGLIGAKSDDLPNIKKAQKEIDKDLQGILKQVPVFENQIGAIIVGIKGVVGIEAFNHPKSWKAQYKEVIEQYSDELSKKVESELISFDESKVNRVIKKFLTGISELSEIKRIDENSYSIKMQQYIGEAVTLNNHIVHFFIMEDEDNEEEVSQPAGPMVFGLQTSLPMKSNFLDRNVTKKGFTDIFHTINKEGGKATWSELENGTKISTQTLSNRLKEGKRANIIGECIKNGRKAYFRK